MLRTSDKRLFLGSRLDDTSTIPYSALPFTPDQRIITPAYPEFGAQCGLARIQAGATVTGSWITASKAFAIPFALSDDVVVTHLGWRNGSAAGSNHDIGIYRAVDLSLVVSTGSVAGSGSSVLQSVDITDTPLPRGQYYLAKVVDATTANRVRFYGSGTAGNLDILGGMISMVSAIPLPSTFVAAAPPGTMRIPDIYFATRTPEP